MKAHNLSVTVSKFARLSIPFLLLSSFGCGSNVEETKSSAEVTPSQCQSTLTQKGLWGRSPSSSRTGTDWIQKDRRLEKDYIEPQIQHSQQLLLAPQSAVTQTLGLRNTIVILVNFRDQPTVKPWSINSIQNTVFTDVSNQFFESSYQQTSLIGTTIGWYTLAIDSTSPCDNGFIDQVATQAQAAARADGKVLEAYQHQIYVFPTVNSCVWSGLGTVGPVSAGYTQVWINGRPSISVIGHEFGHSFGLYHSNALFCGENSSIGSQCNSYEYGDPADMMGNLTYGHFNAYQKEKIGWLGTANSPKITRVEADGTYIVEPYESYSSNPKALKIYKETLSDGSQDFYYIEFRQPNGFDSILSIFDYFGGNLHQGVLVHIGNSKGNQASYLLDMNPGTPYFFDSALKEGASFIDPISAGGIAILATSITSTSARVTVKFSDPNFFSSCKAN